MYYLNKQKEQRREKRISIVPLIVLIITLATVIFLISKDVNADYSQNIWLKEYQERVVVIISEFTNGSGGLGSGFFVSEDGYIITNKHILKFAGENAVKINVYTKDLNRYGARIVGFHSVVDIAVIKIETYEPVKYFEETDVVNDHMVFVGDSVYAIGHPLGMIWTVTKGIITSTERFDSKGTQYYQIDAPINFGNSGGVLVNEWGKILGVPTLAIPPFAAEDISFCIKTKVFIEEVKELIYEDISRLEVIEDIWAYKEKKTKPAPEPKKQQIIIEIPR